MARHCMAGWGILDLPTLGRPFRRQSEPAENLLAGSLLHAQSPESWMQFLPSSRAFDNLSFWVLILEVFCVLETLMSCSMGFLISSSSAANLFVVGVGTSTRSRQASDRR